MIPTELLPAVLEPMQTETIMTESVEMPTETSTDQAEPLLEEVEVVPLKLPEDIQAASFEYSGLTWFGENLVLLPQYPEGKNFSRDGVLFAISKNDVLTAINDPDYELPVKNVPILNTDLREFVKGFEGFESILFVGQDVYLTVETHGGDPMMGYLIKGSVEGELESITLDPQSLVELEPLSQAQNATFEAMTAWNGSLYVIYEHNSKQNSALPVAYEYTQDLVFVREVSFPSLDFRVTDATETDEIGRFWVMNYFYPGDTHLAVDQDPIVLNYGQGETHAEYEQVERLIQLQIGPDGISRIDQAPIYLKLLDDDVARNWEGVVLLDDIGFLMITDTYPESILGFCLMLR